MIDLVEMLDLAEEMVKLFGEDMLAEEDAFRTAFDDEQTMQAWYWHVILAICSTQMDTPDLLRFAGETIAENPTFQAAVSAYLHDYPEMWADTPAGVTTATQDNLFVIIFDIAHEEGWMNRYLTSRYWQLVGRLYQVIHRPDFDDSHAVTYRYLPRKTADSRALFTEITAYIVDPSRRALHVAGYVHGIATSTAQVPALNEQIAAQAVQARLYLLRDVWLKSILSPVEHAEISEISPDIIGTMYEPMAEMAREKYLQSLWAEDSSNAGNRYVPHVALTAYRPAAVTL